MYVYVYVATRLYASFHSSTKLVPRGSIWNEALTACPPINRNIDTQRKSVFNNRKNIHYYKKM